MKWRLPVERDEVDRLLQASIKYERLALATSTLDAWYVNHTHQSDSRVSNDGDVPSKAQ
jgi:hypothetical protein